MAGEPLRVLGIDPGLTRCGLGVVDGPPSAPRMVAGDCVRTPADDGLAERLLTVHREVGRAIERHRPAAVACERVLFSRNARTAMAVGQAAGVALLAAAQAGLPVVSYSPNDVKLTVAGHGGASKGAVGRMVRAQLDLAEVPEPADVADALAVALCHLARGRMADAAGRGPAPGGWAAVLERPHVRVAGGTAGREAR